MPARLLKRYDDNIRLNHWLVVLLFAVAGLTGLAVFHPSLYFLAGLFGGGQWTRTLHPYFGVAMVLGFLVMFVKLWRENLLQRRDLDWIRRSGDMLRGNKAAMPPVDKYNPAQKLVFWASGASLVVLLVTGVMFWRPWFEGSFSVPVQRVAIVLHAIAAVVLILTTVIHVYAAIWIKGTMQAMLRGTVTEAWARQSHELWYRRMVASDPPDGTAAPGVRPSLGAGSRRSGAVS